MNLTDFDYNLPEEAIALYPPQERGGSRLLVLDRQTGQLQDDHYTNLVEYLQSGDLLVINNTRVLPARLLAHTEAGSQRELLLLEQHGKSRDHHQSLAMHRGKLRAGQTLVLDKDNDIKIKVEEVFANGTASISCQQDLWELAEQVGSVPLPPYMHRSEGPGDRERYQTVFARAKGSVAAPTASLNLTEELLLKIHNHGVHVVEITLHVGLGTFMPIRVDDVAQHKMHQEYFEINVDAAEAIRLAKQDGRRVVAVGTTVTRTLEYAAEQILTGQQSISGEADIFIYPGYKFKMVDAMLTNFHAPESTVLMMAAAFASWPHLQAAYRHAMDKNYKFLSYGDSMFIMNGVEAGPNDHK